VKGMSKVTRDLILTAGPSITEKEVYYVLDAGSNGWNKHHSDYIRMFESAFARYIGVRYAMATSSCTGALHLALSALGIGPGDEVIIPEITWVATASAVIYTGATPVFADVERSTWTLDPRSMEACITQRTKAVIPVHLYGHPVDMEPILSLANKHGIAVIEDAAQSIGTVYKGKKTGNLGHVAVFSFQGAKALVTGEGGMLVTNDPRLYERARVLNDHGRDPSRTLYSAEIGYKYKMSNIQAALGLAQVERAEEIVARKRQIYRWYSERLANVPHLQLNVEKPGTRNTYWMTSIVLGEEINQSREEVMAALLQRNIDTRPFFPPLSSLPMFQCRKEENPVAYRVGSRGINLPSGHERTEEEIDYICEHLKEVLGVATKRMSVQPTGWLAFRDRIWDQLAQKKKELSAPIPIMVKENEVGRLIPITWQHLNDEHVLQKLMDWRTTVQDWFPTQSPVTLTGTRRWLDRAVLRQPDRVLFLVEDDQGKTVGHVGLNRFQYQDRACELDNIVRGENGVFPGGMTLACSALIKWAFEHLQLDQLFLRVFAENNPAIKLYKRLGFRELQRIPMIRLTEGETVKYVPLYSQPYRSPDRYFVTMLLPKKRWENRSDEGF